MSHLASVDGVAARVLNPELTNEELNPLPNELNAPSAASMSDDGDSDNADERLVDDDPPPELVHAVISNALDAKTNPRYNEDFMNVFSLLLYLHDSAFDRHELSLPLVSKVTDRTTTLQEFLKNKLDLKRD